MTKKSGFQCDATTMSWTCSKPWTNKKNVYSCETQQQKIRWRFVELYRAGNVIFKLFVVNWLAFLFVDNCLVENRTVAPSSRNEIFRRENWCWRQPGDGTTGKKTPGDPWSHSMKYTLDIQSHRNWGSVWLDPQNMLLKHQTHLRRYDWMSRDMKSWLLNKPIRIHGAIVYLSTYIYMNAWFWL